MPEPRGLSSPRPPCALNRRLFLQGSAALALLPSMAAAAQQAGTAHAAQASLQWLDDAPPRVPGLHSFGVPWPMGAQSPDQPFRVRTASGESLPSQSWVMATWPDGSLKWSGHAISGPVPADPLAVSPGRPGRHPDRIRVRRFGDEIRVTTGALDMRFGTSGTEIVRQALLGGKPLIDGLRLVCLSQDRPDRRESVTVTKYLGRIDNVTIEQEGPVRTVLRFEGMHEGGDQRAWLPFTLRVTIGAGTDGFDLTHTFIFDGDAEQDFITGLGIETTLPMTGDLHNRHVRFAGEDGGVWGEAVRNIPGWAGRRFPYSELFAAQLRGEQVTPVSRMDAQSQEMLATVPAFDDFSLRQLSADEFAVRKRAEAVSSWLNAGHGDRSAGAAFLGSAHGGLLVGLEDFWQRHPSSIDIRDARRSEATLTTWLWSPEAPPMDLRHYSEEAHGLPLQYEDITEGYSTPYGIAHSSRLKMWCLSQTPTNERFSEYAAAVARPPRPFCSAARYRDTFCFGVLSVEDRSTPLKAMVEDQHTALLDYYLTEVEQQQWYGFWDFGDVRHGYDSDRRRWRYDVGGYAWANSELAPDVWLWHAFLRSGRADLFRMATAMTRHTGEVDVYHAGPLAGLGSRHNVSHWGGGAKEARISQALYRRYLYYLTADDRIGELMEEVYDADFALVEVNPLRKILPDPEEPTYARTGPDWFAFASNWLVAWERTGNTKWRDKLVTGMRSIAAAPNGMLSGPAFGYDPGTGILTPRGEDFQNSFHLVTIMGGGEVAFELVRLLDVPEFDQSFLTFCEVYNAPPERRAALIGQDVRGSIFGYPQWHARLTAFVGAERDEDELRNRAWTELLGGGVAHDDRALPVRPRTVGPPVVLEQRQEIENISTNHAAQWALNMIEVMALAPDGAPTDMTDSWAALLQRYEQGGSP